MCGKSSLYNSQSVLSVCTEYKHNYLHIISHLSREIDWHNANRVEHGEKFCLSI